MTNPMHFNPLYTVALLDVLQLTEAEFQAIHHRGDKADIESHRAYCLKIKNFQANSGNVRTAKRLEEFMLSRLMQNAVAKYSA